MKVLLYLRRDEDELPVLIAETKPQILLRYLLPVDGVKEDVPLVQAAEGRPHHVPESADEAELSVAFLSSTEQRGVTGTVGSARTGEMELQLLFFVVNPQEDFRLDLFRELFDHQIESSPYSFCDDIPDTNKIIQSLFIHFLNSLQQLFQLVNIGFHS